VEQEVEISQTAAFECFGNKVVWMFQNDEELPPNAQQRYDGILEIRNAHFQNQGYYECRAEYFSGDGLFYSRGYLTVYGNYWVCTYSYGIMAFS